MRNCASTGSAWSTKPRLSCTQQRSCQATLTRRLEAGGFVRIVGIGDILAVLAVLAVLATKKKKTRHRHDSLLALLPIPCLSEFILALFVLCSPYRILSPLTLPFSSLNHSRPTSIFIILALRLYVLHHPCTSALLPSSLNHSWPTSIFISLQHLLARLRSTAGFHGGMVRLPTLRSCRV